MTQTTDQDMDHNQEASDYEQESEQPVYYPSVVEMAAAGAGEGEAAAQAEAPRQGNWISRSGPVRIALGLVGAVAVLVVVAFLLTQAMRTARSSPIGYDPFPGAAVVARTDPQESGPRNDRVVYQAAVPIQQVYDFYAARMGRSEFGSGDNGCKKIYVGNTPEEQSEAPGKWSARCAIDNSQDNITQRLLITISFKVETGLTVIEVRRDWGG